MKIMTLHDFYKKKITADDYGDEIALVNTRENRVTAIVEIKDPGDIEVEMIYTLRIK